MKNHHNVIYLNEEQIDENPMERVGGWVEKLKKSKNSDKIDFEKSALKTMMLNDFGANHCSCKVCKYKQYDTKLENECKRLYSIYLRNTIGNPNYYYEYTKNQYDFLTRFLNSLATSDVSLKIHKVNYMHRLFYNNYYNIRQQISYKCNFTSGYKKHLRMRGLMSFNGLETIFKYETLPMPGDIIGLQPNQVRNKNNNYQTKKQYKFKEAYGLDSEGIPDHYWLYHVTPEFIIRFTPVVVYTLTAPDDDSPFQDSTLKAFEHYLTTARGDGEMDETIFEDNYITLYACEMIEKRSNNDPKLFNNLVKQRRYSDDPRYGLFTTLNLYNSEDKYKVTDYIHDYFNEEGTFSEYLNELNKKATRETTVKPIETKTLIVPPDRTEEHFEDRKDRKDHQDHVDDHEDREDHTEYHFDIKEILLKFSYNPEIKFADKTLIEDCIGELLRTNDKATELFSQYNYCHIIKDISKNYTKQRYINIVLHHTITNSRSPQYHMYLNKHNKIERVTAILNLI